MKISPLSKFIVGGITVCLSAFSVEVALAQATKVMSKEQMIEALRLDKAKGPSAAAPAGTRKVKTRGLSLDDDEQTNAPAGGGLGAPALTSPPAQAELSLQAPVAAAAPAAAPAQSGQAAQARNQAPTQQKSIDLDIPFEFNSDRMTLTGMQILDSLGEALTSDALANVKFVVLEGHTDAVGNAAYNQGLSQRRAEAARRYITFKFRINSGRVNAIGKGFTELADPSRPHDAINRRVRVVVSG
ncbi:MAG: hypothetical protein RLZZ502_626 [Pseudomonadota bacterium]|jgi:outer membrane protein OmpA-like peptidoglycan-associated protein